MLRSYVWISTTPNCFIGYNMTIVSIQMASLPHCLAFASYSGLAPPFSFRAPNKKITKGPSFAPKQTNLSIYLSKYNCLKLISMVVKYLNIENITHVFLIILWDLFCSIKTVCIIETNEYFP